jgi:hypothetical protein
MTQYISKCLAFVVCLNHLLLFWSDTLLGQTPEQAGSCVFSSLDDANTSFNVVFFRMADSNYLLLTDELVVPEDVYFSHMSSGRKNDFPSESLIGTSDERLLKYSIRGSLRLHRLAFRVFSEDDILNELVPIIREVAIDIDDLVAAEMNMPVRLVCRSINPFEDVLTYDGVVAGLLHMSQKSHARVVLPHMIVQPYSGFCTSVSLASTQDAKFLGVVLPHIPYENADCVLTKEGILAIANDSPEIQEYVNKDVSYAGVNANFAEGQFAQISNLKHPSLINDNWIPLGGTKNGGFSLFEMSNELAFSFDARKLSINAVLIEYNSERYLLMSKSDQSQITSNATLGFRRNGELFEFSLHEYFELKVKSDQTLSSSPLVIFRCKKPFDCECLKVDDEIQTHHSQITGERALVGYSIVDSYLDTPMEIAVVFNGQGPNEREGFDAQIYPAIVFEQHAATSRFFGILVRSSKNSVPKLLSVSELRVLLASE